MERAIAWAIVIWAGYRFIITGIFTVAQNERAVKTSWGRAQRLPHVSLNPAGAKPEDVAEAQRYHYPTVKVLPPGGPYLKMPWERVHKISIATNTINIALDTDSPTANRGGMVLEAVTKDQLNIGLKGSLRYTVSEQNLYAFLFGIKSPVAHILGYFVSILRERIANFEAKHPAHDPNLDAILEKDTQGISVNDLRKNLSEINGEMERECGTSVARYGVKLDAVLITEIDPPPEVESALAAINTAVNSVSSDVSRAKAGADQKIVQSRKAVEIETLKAQGEVEMLAQLAAQLRIMKKKNARILPLYLRNVRLPLLSQVKRIIKPDIGPRI